MRRRIARLVWKMLGIYSRLLRVIWLKETRLIYYQNLMLESNL